MVTIGQASGGGAQGRALRFPSRIARILPGSIVNVGPDRYAPSFTFDQLVPRKGSGEEYFLDPLSGSGSNTGLSPSSPLATFAQAYAKPQCASIQIAGGSTFDRTQDTWVNQLSTRNIAINAPANAPAILLGSDRVQPWTQNGTYPTVYQYPRTSVLSVCDRAILNSDGIWTKYAVQTTLAACAATPGSWYTDGAVVYVRTLDGRPADNDIQVMLSTSAVWRPANQVTISYNNIFFQGVQTVGARAFSASVFPTIIANNCQFMYTNTTTNGWQGLGANRIFFNCTAQGNAADGFNDHFSGRIGDAIEIGCNGSFNGDPVLAVNDNGTTMHDGGTIFRLDGWYEGNYGPNMADVSWPTYTCSINCTAKNSRKLNDPGNITVGGDSFGPTTSLFIGQKCIQLVNLPNYKDIIIASGGITGWFAGANGTQNPTINGSTANFLKDTVSAQHMLDHYM